MGRTSEVKVTQNGSPGMHKRRTEITDELHRLSWEFMRTPAMPIVERMEELRAELTTLEKRIVVEVVNRKLFAAIMADAESGLVTSDDAEEMSDDDYIDSPSTY